MRQGTAGQGMTSDLGRLFIAGDGYLRLVPPVGHTYREVKESIGATWDASTRGWKCPALRTYALQIIEMVGKDALWIDEQVLRIGDGPGFPLNPHWSHKRLQRLYRFQRDAVTYLGSNPHGTLLNVSPGLGKSAISIVAAQAFSVSRALIVAPASLLFNWEREIAKWGDDQEAMISHGSPPDASGWCITTYESVVRHPEWFKVHWDLLIVDESVLIKNRTTQRFDGLQAIRRSVDQVWLLSGSPTTRFADDLWTQMWMCYPAAFKSFWRFAERFCVFESNVWARTGKSIVGTKESRDITWELGDLMLTINQEEVLDLPEYLPDLIDVALTARQARAYAQMLRDFLMELDGRELTADNKLAQLVRLQQVVSGMANLSEVDTDSAKNDLVLELLDAHAYQTPMLIWTHWKGNADDLTHRLRRSQINAARVSGDDTPKTRDRKLQAYKAGETDVLVLSMAVGKFGHTLTDTRTVVYLDKTWAADDFIQSMRRVRRIGLKHRPVLLTLKAPGTTDDLLEMNLSGKMPSIARITNSELRELLRGLGM